MNYYRAWFNDGRRTVDLLANDKYEAIAEAARLAAKRDGDKEAQYIHVQRLTQLDDKSL